MLKLKQIFQKNKAVTAKTPLFMIVLLFVVAILFVLTWASDRAVLNRNDVFSILMVSTKKRYSSFLKKIFAFQKIWIKVNVLKRFKTFTDCHIKICRSLKQRAILKIPNTVKNLCSFPWLQPYSGWKVEGGQKGPLPISPL